VKALHPTDDPVAAIAELAGCTAPWLFGVRHHSPACAAALPPLLARLAPAAVAVELPADLAPWLPWLAHSDAEAPLAVDDAVLEALVTVFRDLRSGRSVEGWAVEKPSSVMSTAEAVAVASSIGLAATYFPGDRDVARLLPEYLLGVVMKDDPRDRGKLLAYWDATVKRRAEGEARLWKQLHQLRRVLE